MTAVPVAVPATPVLPASVRAPRRALLPSTAAGTLGPALLVAAGYVDPGNWGTDVAAGARFGYGLVWVLALATGLALFLQYLSVRLGLASGQDLASLLRTRLPRPARALLIPPVLGILVVTEIVEVLGVVIGVQLLTGWSTGGSVAAATGLIVAILVAPPGVARRTVYTCLGLVGAVYLTVLVRHGVGDVLGGLRPQPLPPGGIVVAAGLIGAVVMPHNVLLHSALARDLRHAADRKEGGRASEARLAGLSRRSLTTTAAALGVAFAVNCAIMSITASGSGRGADLAGALGSVGAVTTVLFAITLIGAGLASSTAGGMVGADVISRLLPGFPAPPAVRRIACLVPGAAIAGSGLPQLSVLVWSQVLLTVALPLVLVPLVWFCSERRTVGGWALSPSVRVVAGLVVAGVFAAGAASLFAG
ncbi:Nramp family divalent metal transporter [Cryptosporangium sp. NPDC051539]|uniref:Nramp family divalent metal transporter n=1 Tax=Cryptosporangium sp. NPDC051539 TaxID=3363962 RepID=UPI00379DF672